MNNTLIIAHRSGPTVYPEQTILSAKQALEDGADIVEIDVRFTKDLSIAICHDSTAERVFGEDKRIDEMTKDEFLSLRHKDNPAFCSHLFRDYLAANIKPILIHIKEDTVIEKMIDELEEFGYNSADVTFGVQSIKAVKSVRARWSDSKILAFMPRLEMAEDFINEGVTYIRLWEKWLDTVSLDFSVPVWIMTNSISVGYTTADKLKEFIQAEKITGVLVNNVCDIVK